MHLGGNARMTLPDSIEPSDADLVEKALGGDEGAFGALVVRYQGLVCSVAYALTTSFGRSEEIAQETFLAAWTRLAELRQPERFKSWILAMARNLSITARRRRESSMPIMPPSHEREIPSADPSPLDGIISREEEQALGQALAAIPETYRLPVVLFYREQGSLERVAEALNISPKSVTMRLTRARRLLRREVEARLEAALEGTRPGARFAASVAGALALAYLTKPAQASASARSSLGARRFATLSRVTLSTSLALLGAAVLPLVLLARDAPTTSGDANISLAEVSGAAVGEEHSGVAPSRANGVNRAGWLSRPVSVQSPQELVPDEVLTFSFEDGQLPEGFNHGALAPCPPGARGKSCVVGTVRLNSGLNGVTLMLWHKDIRHSAGFKLEFDYWVDSAVNVLDVEVGDLARHSNYVYLIRSPARGAWAHVSLPLDDFRPNPLNGNSPPTRMVPGDRLTKIEIAAPGASTSRLFIDNVRLGR
jgi:RNA polymerase sigma factor (sigma-70 family)